MTLSDIRDLAYVREALATGRARAVRLRARLSASEVARAVGIGPSTFSRWESGEKRPTGAPALELARLLRELDDNAAHRG